MEGDRRKEMMREWRNIRVRRKMMKRRKGVTFKKKAKRER